LIVAGGDRPQPFILSTLPPPALTITADSGVDHARSLGLNVDLVVGDLDSADRRNVAWARDHGATIEQHPAAKDETDLELAMQRVAELADRHGLSDVVILGLGGGRVDHWLANLVVLGGPIAGGLVDRGIRVTAIIDRARLSVIRGMGKLQGRAGELVSLLPVGGPARGVSTAGLVYRLDDEDLEAGVARGVSNIFGRGAGGDEVSDESGHQIHDGESGGNNGGLVSAQISVNTGTVLAIQPYAYVADVPDPPSR